MFRRKVHASKKESSSLLQAFWSLGQQHFISAQAVIGVVAHTTAWDTLVALEPSGTDISSGSWTGSGRRLQRAHLRHPYAQLLVKGRKVSLNERLNIGHVGQAITVAAADRNADCTCVKVFKLGF